MSAYSAGANITFADVSLQPVLAPYYERVSFVGKSRRWMIRKLPRWQRWKERRGLGAYVVRRGGL